MIILNVFKNLLIGLGLAVLAWFAVHFLAIFGIFVMAAFPLRWILNPDSHFCILCKISKNKECSLCKSGREIYAMLSNMLIILAITGLSLGTVLLEYGILKAAGIPGSPKTVAFVIPPKSQHRIGEIFPMQIELSGIEVPVNAVQADIGYDPTQLTVVEVSTKDSFANIFIQKEINNDGGWVRLTGGLPNPGYFSDHGIFGTVYFQAKSAGLAEIKFLSSSLVLANDGKGTNVLKDYPKTSYLIIPDRLTPTEIDAELKSISTDAPSPVLGAHTAIGGGEGVQLSFIDSAPNIPVAKDSVLGASTGGTEDASQSSSPNVILNLIQKLDSIIFSLWNAVFKTNI